MASIMPRRQVFLLLVQKKPTNYSQSLLYLPTSFKHSFYSVAAVFIFLSSFSLCPLLAFCLHGCTDNVLSAVYSMKDDVDCTVGKGQSNQR